MIDSSRKGEIVNEEIATVIRVSLAKKNKNLSWLATELGTSKSNVSNIMRRLSNGKGVRTETLSKIERVIDIKFFNH